MYINDYSTGMTIDTYIQISDGQGPSLNDMSGLNDWCVCVCVRVRVCLCIPRLRSGHSNVLMATSSALS